ncbi:MAG TPA: type II toxin-antitoxin system RelE/ParE family toxin [Desulfobacteraceae bacterium]|nr:type II toxin-antitoxin system RelE/ParE family toxin [Desulfobacteraceae bacterium]HPJ69177.1 type II toxin-antitoxin system RelE/ParE family toxin [Desulfobacteraceae bacterium]HPQ29786.1 type II toxin-antitoxin system RelE/ParE family toxin [Desulfobacteraceae bacterium]
MKTAFKKSFAKDLKTHSRNKNLLTMIQKPILQAETADSVADIKNLKKLKAEGHYYRIRIGNYRIGLIIENKIVTFVRVLHRGEIYRYFP